jgi:hypothetical protein
MRGRLCVWSTGGTSQLNLEVSGAASEKLVRSGKPSLTPFTFAKANRHSLFRL